MISPASTFGPTAYWYLTRGTGLVSLVLLTAIVVLGVLGPMRVAISPRWPRFAIDSLHRDLSLLAVVLIVVHVVTTVLDGFAPIGLLDAVIPFRSPYRPVWLGLGAVAFDLILALVITSLVRRRLGYGAWRSIHWLAYACWPVAVLHGLGTGSDSRQAWTLALTFACVGAVALATVARLRRAERASGFARGAGAIAAGLTPVGLLVFTLLGPLTSDWARTAGTPSSLLASVHRPAVGGPSTTTAPSGALKLPFTSQLSGTMTQAQTAGGAILDLELRLSGAETGGLRIRLGGHQLSGGGLSLSGSQVDLALTGQPQALVGKITALNGTQLAARVGGGAQLLNVLAELQIDQQTGAVSGVLHARRAA